ncbi:LuxR C-terminal-related transcriptional regulator [Streptomyces sioyaensis]|uniref:LuxR C-terminal-related transcriptional regulator n=1 Tax=Streptomyces sioyaensis TaxID=67364 RepID=UPI0037B8085C
MLDELGLGPDAETVYGVMLKAPQLGRSELAGTLGWAPDRVEDAWDELSRLSLVRPSAEQPGRMRLVDPELSLQNLLVRQERQVLARQKAVADARMEIGKLLLDLVDAAPAPRTPYVRQFTGTDAIRSQLERHAHSCEREIAVFAPRGAQIGGPPEASRQLDQAVLARGLRARYVCLASLGNDRAGLAHARWLRHNGGDVRCVPQLPLHMAVYDARTAVVPIDPEAADKGILVMDGGGVVTALRALFEQLWQQAEPLDTAPAPADGDRPNGQERAVLELLVAGHTDEVVARNLGISVRTSRRITAELMNRLSARSRFQAGALAAARGWLDPGTHPVVAPRR